MQNAQPGPRPEPLDHHRLPSTDTLAGRTFTFDIEQGGCLVLAFEQTGLVRWSASGVDHSGKGEDSVDVVHTDEETYFIDIDVAEPALESLTVVVRESTGWALLVHQRRFHPEETWSRGPEVLHQFAAARIRGTIGRGPAPAPTRDLIGRRHFHRYSPNNLYEHIYLNSEKFCAHNVHTFGTPGRCDCHPASYHKIDDELYVLCWREYDSAAAMVCLLDLRQLRVTGKVHAPESFLHSVNRPLGGLIVPVTEELGYPGGLGPR